MSRRNDKGVPMRRRSPARRDWTRASDYGARGRPWWRRQVSPIMVMLPLAAFTAVFLWDGPPEAFGLAAPQPTATDREAARFALCGGFGIRDDCVIDGDTFWYGGEKIRIADINTPETGEPGCAREAELGAAATARLHALLNEGPFTLEETGRDRDGYGRLLRTVTRDGASLGDTLVREGLAEEWRGRRSEWC